MVKCFNEKPRTDTHTHVRARPHASLVSVCLHLRNSFWLVSVALESSCCSVWLAHVFFFSSSISRLNACTPMSRDDRLSLALGMSDVGFSLVGVSMTWSLLTSPGAEEKNVPPNHQVYEIFIVIKAHNIIVSTYTLTPDGIYFQIVFRQHLRAIQIHLYAIEIRNRNWKSSGHHHDSDCTSCQAVYNGL